MSVTDTSKPNGHGNGEGNGSLSPEGGVALTPSPSLTGGVNGVHPLELLDRPLTGTERSQLSRWKAKQREQGLLPATHNNVSKAKPARPAGRATATPRVATDAANVATLPATAVATGATLHATPDATQRATLPATPATLRVAPPATLDATLRSQPATARQQRAQRGRLRLWSVYVLCALQPTVMVLFVAAAALATADLGQSATALWRMGNEIQDRILFAIVAGVAGVVVLFGFVGMGMLWRRKRRTWAVALGLVYLVVLVMNAIFNIMFTSWNIGDVVAERQQTNMLQAALQVELGQKIEERGKLKIPRNVTLATVEASTKALNLLCPADRITGDCRSKMDKHTLLLVDLDQSAKAKQLDDEIGKLRRDIRGTRANGSADPMVEGIQQLGALVGVDVSAKFAHGMRTGGLLIIGLVGGVLLACAKALYEGNVAQMIIDLGWDQP